MAVQKSKKSRSRRDMRRHNEAKRLNPSVLSEDPETGEKHRRHHITPDGFYRGRQVIADKAVNEEESD